MRDYDRLELSVPRRKSSEVESRIVIVMLGAASKAPKPDDGEEVITEGRRGRPKKAEDTGGVLVSQPQTGSTQADAQEVPGGA